MGLRELSAHLPIRELQIQRPFNGKISIHSAPSKPGPIASNDLAPSVGRLIAGRISKGLRTPEPVFFRPILQALSDLGGSAKRSDVFQLLEHSMRGKLKPIEYQTLSSEAGQLRWQNTAQWAHNLVVKEGLLTTGLAYGKLPKKAKHSFENPWLPDLVPVVHVRWEIRRPGWFCCKFLNSAKRSILSPLRKVKRVKEVRILSERIHSYRNDMINFAELNNRTVTMTAYRHTAAYKHSDAFPPHLRGASTFLEWMLTACAFLNTLSLIVPRSTISLQHGICCVRAASPGVTGSYAPLWPHGGSCRAASEGGCLSA